MDLFDQIPDPLILQIFDSIPDVKTLARCRTVCRRFDSLVPQCQSLVLRVDRVVSESDLDSLVFLSFLKTLFKSLLSKFLPPKAFTFPSNDGVLTSPPLILRGFDRIRELDIEFPAGDLKLEKGTVVRYKAKFGASLKSCVILGFGGGKSGGIFSQGLRDRVLWAISVLVAACARHVYVAREVVGKHGDLVRLAVRDRDGEGEVLMDDRGLAECREAFSGSEPGAGRRAVPRVRMKMSRLDTVQIAPGFRQEGATLVVVRPSGSQCDGVDDADVAMEAFGGGVYGNAVQALLKCKSDLLVINSL